MMISDAAEMDKSTVLTHLSKQIKQNFQSKWVVRIDLNDHTDKLKEKAAEFVSYKSLQLESCVETAIFDEHC
jgi:hypothetical protein